MVQTNLNGVWRTKYGGCPHLHRGDIDLCDANEMRSCIYETGNGPCEIFESILAEWRLELGICHCGTKLESNSGQEGIPAHLFCPKCMDYAYDQATGQVIAQLI